MSSKISLILDLLNIGNLIVSHAHVFVLFEQSSGCMDGQEIER